MTDSARLRYLLDNAVGGDLLPPAWAELVRALPVLLDELDALRAVAEAARAARANEQFAVSDPDAFWMYWAVVADLLDKAAALAALDAAP
jgi:hypothetical protein